MSGIDTLKHEWRDFTTDGVKASGLHEPVKGEVRRGLSLLRNEMSAIANAVVDYETIALRDAATPSGDGELVRVYRNNGDPADPANGYWQWNADEEEYERADWLFTLVATGLGIVLADDDAADGIAYRDALSVGEALDQLRYQGLNITSFTSTVVQAEVGATINALNLAWAVAGAEPTAQTLGWTGGGSASLIAADRAKNLTGLGRTANTTFTLTATDGDAPDGVTTDSDTATVDLVFLHKSHFGWIDEVSGATLSSADVNGLDHDWFEDQTTRSLSFATDAIGYLWFSQLASLPDPIFKIDGGVIGPVRTTRTHVNAQGHSATFADFRLSARVDSGTSGLLEIIR